MRAPADKDPARSPLASGDSGVVELLDGTRITYRPIGPENAAALLSAPSRSSPTGGRGTSPTWTA
jgi:hypothetical protein